MMARFKCQFWLNLDLLDICYSIYFMNEHIMNSCLEKHGLMPVKTLERWTPSAYIGPSRVWSLLDIVANIIGINSLLLTSVCMEFCSIHISVKFVPPHYRRWVTMFTSFIPHGAILLTFEKYLLGHNVYINTCTISLCYFL